MFQGEKINDDIGLYVAGDGGNASRKELFKTLDGYVYAIPMFRLYRKPSCGKCTPFEYSKFNPKCDYSKFSKLMKEDKVERVISENIKGRSLVNLLNPISQYGRPTYVTNDGDKFRLTKSADNNWYIWSISNQTNLLIPGKTYTFIINITAISSDANGIICRLHDIASENNYITLRDTANYDTQPKIGRSKTSITIPSDWSSCGDLHLISLRDTSPSGSFIEISEVSILEGDYTNKEIPEFFTGLKSLGEDDNNLITIKNGILDKDTYDINDGNQKLNTFEDITHISSDNTIKPIVEAVIKNGEEETPLDSLNTKLETTGEEIIEFTKIKGKTIQNLAIDGVANNNTFTYSNNICEVSYSSSNLSGINFKKLLKPNTTYTYIINVITNSINNSDIAGSIKIQVCNRSEGYVNIKQGVTGIIKDTITTTSDMSSDFSVLVRTIHATSGKVQFTDFMLFEGDYKNTPLEETPYFEGIKAVGEDEDNMISLKSNNKNLIPPLNSKYWTRPSNIVSVGDDFVVLQGSPSIHQLDDFPVIPNSDYVLSGYLSSSNRQRVEIRFPNSSEYIISTWVSKHERFKINFNSMNNNKINIWLRAENSIVSRFYNIQLELGTDTEYESYKHHIQNIQLKEPLRSLSNEVYDEIVGNKIIKRVEKILLDSDKPWIMVTGTDIPDSSKYGRFSFPLSNAKVSGLAMSDNFVYSPGYSESIDKIYITNTPSLSVTIKLDSLETQDLDGFKKWLSENPTTVYYELANPIEEYIEQVYDKESIKTYQLDAPLRGLPIGAKDEIKDNILIRRCGERIFDGSDDEQWGATSTTSNSNYICINITDVIPDSRLLCDKFNRIGISDNVSKNPVGMMVTSYEPIGSNLLRIVPPIDDFSLENAVQWLKNNPITVVYELANPIEEELSSDNHNYYPYHDINTYCDGIYVGNGRNYIINDNKMPTEDSIILDSDFRQIEEELTIEDCRYKKSEYGYTDKYITSSTKNILNYKEISNSLGKSADYILIENGIKVKSDTVQQYSYIPIVIGYLKPDTTYSLSFNSNVVNGEAYIAIKYGENNTVKISPTSTIFTTPNEIVKDYRVQLYCAGYTASIGEVDYTNIQLVESDTIDNDYVPYKKTIKYLENIEENDIVDLRHLVSLTGFSYPEILQNSFDKLLKGEL